VYSKSPRLRCCEKKNNRRRSPKALGAKEGCRSEGGTRHFKKSHRKSKTIAIAAGRRGRTHQIGVIVASSGIAASGSRKISSATAAGLCAR